MRNFAIMFLHMSDGIVMNWAIGKKSGHRVARRDKKEWNNLYSLLKTRKNK